MRPKGTQYDRRERTERERHSQGEGERHNQRERDMAEGRTKREVKTGSFGLLQALLDMEDG